LALAVEADLAPFQIAAVQIAIPQETFSYVGGPYTPGDNPTVGAQFSIAYTVAAALVHRKVAPANFTMEATSDPRVLKLAARVETIALPGAGRYGGAVARIGLHDGRRYERRVSVMKGEPGNPMTEAERFEKVASCIAFAEWPAHVATHLSNWATALDRMDAPLDRLHLILSRGAAT
jgi:2-methylcitrate dehydratase PrpD